jgi:hypothetical protein
MDHHPEGKETLPVLSFFSNLSEEGSRDKYWGGYEKKVINL